MAETTSHICPKYFSYVYLQVCLPAKAFTWNHHQLFYQHHYLQYAPKVNVFLKWKIQPHLEGCLAKFSPFLLHLSNFFRKPTSEIDFPIPLSPVMFWVIKQSLKTPNQSLSLHTESLFQSNNQGKFHIKFGLLSQLIIFQA